MTKLLEIKDKIIRFCENFETYVNLVLKFVIAFALFRVINQGLGYMTQVVKLPITIVLALVCCILPFPVTMVIAALLVVLHVYALSMEAAVVTLILLVIIYLIYFRFTPRESKVAALMPIFLSIGIPYIMPVGSGLLRKASSCLALVCTTVLYYYLLGIKQNEAALTLVTDEDTETFSRFSIAIGQLTDNKEMYLTAGVFLVVTLLVYLVRKLHIEHAWTIAIIMGILLEFLGLLTGYILLNITGRIISLAIGCVISLLIAFLIEFFCMNLDYARTERVQFEDDEYYYYVRAIPKKQVASTERTIKHFGNTGNMGKHIEKHSPTRTEEEHADDVIAQELDIDEDLL